MRIRVIVHSPVGTFVGPWQKEEEENIQNSEELFKKELSYLTLESKSGKLFFQRGLLSNSVIEIEKSIKEIQDL